jgi:hypothetical protein
MPGRVVKNAPFSADVVTERTQTLANGDHIKQTSTAHLFRDSEGRTRREQSLNVLEQVGLASGTSNRTVVFINDPVGGASYALDSTNKTATKSVRPARSGAGGRGAWSQQGAVRSGPNVASRGRGRGAGNNPNIKTESLGTQTMEGVQVQGTRTTMTIPAGQMGNDQPLQIVTERWYSADLQTTLLVKHSDPRSGETVTRYANVSRVEPAPALFQVPPDYQVRQGGRGSQ